MDSVDVKDMRELSLSLQSANSCTCMDSVDVTDMRELSLSL